MGKCNSVNESSKTSSLNSVNISEKLEYILPLANRNFKREDITKNYQFIKFIAEGATSKVFKAENSKKEKFAIKRIIKNKINDSKKSNIIKECEVCLQIDNKNIIKTYEIYEDKEFINIVMELGNIDLFEFINRYPSENIPVDLIIYFLIQIFESIDYLHKNNIIHCDIKPENYMLKFESDPTEIQKLKKATLKLIDFGNIRKKPLNKEKLYEFCGTKEFMAPEALENSGFNEKIDEWAAGILMFNLLTKTDPFYSDSDSEYRDNIKFKNINFDLIENKELRELNKKLLNRFVEKRITANEALEEIKKFKKV